MILSSLFFNIIWSEWHKKIYLKRANSIINQLSFIFLRKSDQNYTKLE